MPSEYPLPLLANASVDGQFRRLDVRSARPIQSLTFAVTEQDKGI